MVSNQWKIWLFAALCLICILPQIGTATALAGGILFSLLFGNPWLVRTTLWSKRLLQLSVVGLGFGLGIEQVWRVGKESIAWTIISILLTLLVGWLLGRVLKTPPRTSLLISFGTAICGGSAIAAMAPVIEAKDDEIAVSLATVFTLNAVALLVFPPLGSLFHLSQHDFGIWAGLAIHDTSSVVGAAAVYGSSALAIATTVKLSRAIWIAPFVTGTAWFNKSKKRVGIPLFIVGFIAASSLRSLVPQFAPVWNGAASVAKQALVLTLFLIGSGLSRSVLQKIGFRPLVQGFVLWLLVITATLVAVRSGLFG
jgi:uncharacterized integral membrane protein (TIGR00698 family)